MLFGKRPPPDKHTAFYYDFSPREMWYFLFGKKVCPRCGGKLIRRKSYETIHGHMPYIDDVSRIDHRKVKHYLYSYSCEQCGASFSLSDLAEKKHG